MKCLHLEAAAISTEAEDYKSRIFQTQSQGEGYIGDEDEDVCAGSVESASSVTLDDESVPNVSPLPPPPYAKC